MCSRLEVSWEDVTNHRNAALCNTLHRLRVDSTATYPDFHVVANFIHDYNLGVVVLHCLQHHLILFAAVANRKTPGFTEPRMRYTPTPTYLHGRIHNDDALLSAQSRCNVA